MCASGARSPDAPTDPCAGITGVTRRASIASISSTELANPSGCGVHAAALLDPEGTVLVVREDIGRHNAVDKVIGWAAREGRLPLRGHALVVSSRAGFEIAQKAAVAGVPVLACVSAATTLAVEVAERSGLTLLGFVREDRATVYTHPYRVTAPGL